ncbi:MAG: hypothetical protein KDK50_02140 [Chlamydiia bacterium]|nr:hypothetical protein [Chlamydiia bacterium]
MEKLGAEMAILIKQEGLMDSDILSGIHSVFDEITLHAIEEGLVDPSEIDPKLSELYDAYENYLNKASDTHLDAFDNALKSVGASLGNIPHKWATHALRDSLKTADQWILDHPRYAEGIYSAVTLIVQHSDYVKEAKGHAEDLMLGIEELEDGKTTEERLLNDSNKLLHTLELHQSKAA